VGELGQTPLRKPITWKIEAARDQEINKRIIE